MKKSIKVLIIVVVLIVALLGAAVLFVNFGNPQWHWRMYAHQARNAQNGLIEPSGSFTGEWNNWDSNGRLISKFHYRNGKRDGSYITYTADNKVLSEGQYKDGELDGVQKVYQDGSRTEIPYAGGVRNGVEKTWYPGGQIAVEAPWINGNQDGAVTFYFENGSIMSSSPYYQGKQEGVKKTWYDTGVLQSDETYRNDMRNGKSEFWTPESGPDMEFNYSDDKMDGVQIWFHSDGSKAREIVMSMGIPHGDWKEWDETGKLTVDEYYEMGEMKAKPKTEKPVPTEEDAPKADPTPQT